MKFYHEYTQHDDPVLYQSFQQVTLAHKMRIKMELMHLDEEMEREGGILIYDGNDDVNIKGFSPELTEKIIETIKAIDWTKW